MTDGSAQAAWPYSNGVMHGLATFRKTDDDNWTGDFRLHDTTAVANALHYGNSLITTPCAIDRVRVTTSAGNFNASHMHVYANQ